MRKHILVTGGNGLVGNALCRTLVERGYSVRSAVRKEGNSSLDTIAIGNIGPQTDWSRALSGIDSVVHCAARVHIMNDQAPNPFKAFREVNVAGTINLAKQAVDAGVNRFIFVSSVKVNGEETGPNTPFRADSTPAPEDPYAVSKHEAEQALKNLAQESGLEVTIVRPPLVYGPGVKANFAALMRVVAQGLPLPLGAVTQNRRSFVFLNNLIDLLIVCIDHPGAANQIFFVSDGEDLSTAELLRRMGQAMGKSPRLIAVPPALLSFCASILGKRDMAHRLLSSLVVDISEAREILNWTPPFSVDEGLHLTASGLEGQ
jgi:nucleoside-diphosphate-sugar epimerase